MKKIIRLIGALLIIIGLLINPWVIEQLFSPDKELDFLWMYVCIVFFDLALITGGLLFIHKSYLIIKFVRKNRVNFLVFIISMVVVLLIFELLLRFCVLDLKCNIPGFNKPWYFIKKDPVDNYNFIEDYWILYRRLSDGKIFDQDHYSCTEPDPFFGKDQKINCSSGCIKTDDNRALIHETQFDNSLTKILFYGDSFTEGAGVECLKDSIPSKLEEHTGIDTLNFGWGGYSFAQIFLKFNGTYPKFNNGIILIGLLPDDLDRSIMLRGILRPYFELSEDNELVLKGVPIDPYELEYWKTKNPKIRSYLFSRIYNSNFGRIVFFYIHHKENEKMQKEREENNKKIKEINGGIFKEFSKIKEENDLTLYFVLYYSEKELSIYDWRHSFIKEKLKENNILFFDTKEYLLNYSVEKNIPISDFYNRNNSHLNELGNDIIAVRISEELKNLASLPVEEPG